MSPTQVRPWRGPTGDRPPVPLPPQRMPVLRGGRPLKRWRYVGVYGPEVMLCAAHAVIAGAAHAAWWAVWDRTSGTLAERSHRRQAGVVVQPGRVHVRERGVEIDLRLDEDEGVETVSPDGAQYAWTRKQGGVPAHGRVTVNGRRHVVEGRAIVDESAGYHARHTAWHWSAGVGVAQSGEPVAWNLVSGIHDGAQASERSVWIAGQPQHVAPVRFAPDLSLVHFSGDGAEPLRFTAEAARSHRERLLVISSVYEQPFGTFAGSLPHAGPLREGYGVMERHEARW
jgi:hypothetical protein